MFWSIGPSVSTQIVDHRSLKEQLLDCVNEIEYVLFDVNFLI